MRRTELSQPRRSCLRAMLACSLLATDPVRAGPRPATLRFTFSRPRSDPRTQWLIRVYSEILANLGIGFEFVELPPSRATMLLHNGMLDGELARSPAFGTQSPQLVMVPEPSGSLEFAAYGLGSPAGGTPWSLDAAQHLRCEYRRGIQEAATVLQRQAVPGRLVSSVASIEQGLRRLQLGRTDLYLDVRECVNDYFASGQASAILLASPRPRMIGIAEATTAHAYLQRRHQALVPELAQALNSMRKRGLLARYRAEAFASPLASP